MPEQTQGAAAQLAQAGLAPKKLFGQNFLVNQGVCAKIADACVPEPGWGVVEIGPGLGALTKELAKRAKRVVAVEIDTALVPLLQKNLAEFDNVEIVCADALKTDLHALLRERLGGLRVTAAGNLPYYITSPILMSVLESRLPVEQIVAMVQKEAAVRLCAGEGSRESGAVTLAVRYYSEPSLLFDVSQGSFYPPPKVTSSVIRLRVRPHEAAPADEAWMFSVIRAAFSQRRKTAANAISAGLGLDKAAVAAGIEAVGLNAAARPERMTLRDFAALSDRLAAIAEN